MALFETTATEEPTEPLPPKPKKAPVMRLYMVVPAKEEGQKDVWLELAAAFAHDDGDGANLVPRGNLVLRKPLPPKEK